MFKKIHPFYYVSILYIVLSVVLGIFLTNFLIIFLGWNIFLATFVFFLSEIYISLNKKKANQLVQSVVLLMFILFFPNTLYVLTDFIHLQNYSFFENYPNVYAFQIADWLVFMHILIGALYSTKLGISSIHKLEPVFKPLFKKYFLFALSILFILSSIGIYIGRFLRFNSWNFLQIFPMITEVFKNLSFFIGIITIFFVLHWVSYFLFSKQEIIDI
jgi:uncharacterized membrane protein